MSGLGSFQLANVGIHLLLALVWAMVAQSGWRFRSQRRLQSRFFRMLPLLASAVAFNYLVFTLIALLPADIDQRSRNVAVLYALNDCTIFIVVAMARHLSRYFPTPELPRPSWAWLATNYGSALVMGFLTLVYVGLVHVETLPPQFPVYRGVRVVYQILMLGLIVWHLVGIARPGVWRAGGASWVARRADVVVLIGGLVSLGCWLLIAATTSYLDRGGGSLWTASTLTLVLDTIMGIGFAIPLAVRTLGAVIRGVVMSVVMLAAISGVYAGTHQLATILAAPPLQPLVGLLTVLAFFLLLVPDKHGHAP